MASRTLSDMVCGFTLTRRTPCALSVSSLSRVMVSGRPASTVYSRSCVRSKLSSSLEHSSSSCGALSVVGVPPPMYSATGRSPARRTA